MVFEAKEIEAITTTFIIEEEIIVVVLVASEGFVEYLIFQ